MENESIVRILLLASLFLIGGCSTVHSNFLAADHQLGYVYSGVNMDLMAVKGMTVCVPMEAKEEQGTPLWKSVPLLSLASMVFIIDMPFSFVADSLLLPIESALEAPAHGKRFSPIVSCDEEGSGGPSLH